MGDIIVQRSGFVRGAVQPTTTTKGIRNDASRI